MPVYEFYKHIDGLVGQARLQGAAASVPGVIHRPWNIPETHPTDGLDISDPAFFAIACDRSALNAAAIASYENGARANAGRMGIVMAAKKAIDYQAAYERALQARHASAVRRRVWAMARRTGHGSSTYGVFGIIRSELDDLRDVSTEVNNTPTANAAGYVE